MKKKMGLFFGIFLFLTGCDYFTPPNNTFLPSTPTKNQVVCRFQESHEEVLHKTELTYVFDKEQKGITKLQLRLDLVYQEDAYHAFKASEKLELRERIKESYCKQSGYQSCMVVWEGQSLVIRSELDITEKTILETFYTDKSKEELLQVYETREGYTCQ